MTLPTDKPETVETDLVRDLYAVARRIKSERREQFELDTVLSAIAELERGAAVEEQLGLAKEAIKAMAEDGWLMHGVEGMSEPQEVCLQAYKTLGLKELPDTLLYYRELRKQRALSGQATDAAGQDASTRKGEAGTVDADSRKVEPATSPRATPPAAPLPTPLTDAFCKAKLDAFNSDQWEGRPEQSAEDAYGDAIDFARSLERRLQRAQSAAGTKPTAKPPKRRKGQ